MQEQLFSLEKQLQFSISHLEKYLRCPKYYELVYIQNKHNYQIFGDRLSLGTILHKVAADYLKLYPEREFDKLKENFENKFRSKFQSNKETWYDLYLESLVKFHEHFKLVKVVAVEERQKAILDDIFISGQIDCIIEYPERNEVVIIDFKEARSEFLEIESKYKSIQLIFYYLLIRNKFKSVFGFKKLKGAYYYFETSDMEKIDFIPMVIEEGKKVIKTIINEIQTKSIFTPKKCELCPICGYKEKCDIGRDITENDFRRSLK